MIAKKLPVAIFPVIRGLVSGEKRLDRKLQWLARKFCSLLIRIGPLSWRTWEPVVPIISSARRFGRYSSTGIPQGDITEFHAAIQSAIKNYREEYRLYYGKHAAADSPAIRDPNPTVVLVPGVGMFSFGKSKTEARITGEFYINAIHVMEGATVARRRKPARQRAAGGTGGSAFRVYV